MPSSGFWLVQALFSTFYSFLLFILVGENLSERLYIVNCFFFKFPLKITVFRELLSYFWIGAYRFSPTTSQLFQLHFSLCITAHIPICFKNRGDIFYWYCNTRFAWKMLTVCCVLLWLCLRVAYAYFLFSFCLSQFLAFASGAQFDFFWKLHSEILGFWLFTYFVFLLLFMREPMIKYSHEKNPYYR